VLRQRPHRLRIPADPLPTLAQRSAKGRHHCTLRGSCVANLRFNDAEDLGGMNRDPRTVGDTELSIAERRRELPPIHEPAFLFVRSDATSKHLDCLRDQRGLDPIADLEPSLIQRRGDWRDCRVQGWCPLLGFNIRLWADEPGGWARSGRIITDVDEVIQHSTLTVNPPP
jgi:hypothetical protein